MPYTEVRTIPKLRLGTRGSRLALAQAHALQSTLQGLHSDLEIEIVTIKTSGDRGLRDRLGAFVREIQEALLEESIDVALHCLKDLPTEEVPGLTLSAYLTREDPRDTIITRGPTFEELPPSAVVGTGSVRRTSQLAAHRSDLTFRPLVGNVDTRLRKLLEGEYDAIVLAIAGLKRLGILDEVPGEGSYSIRDFEGLVVRPLAPAQMLPAPGQAVLVLETREGDEATASRVAALNDEATKRAALAERAFLRTFGGGCSVPVAALASSDGEEIRLVGLTASPNGRRVLTGEGRGSDPADVGAGLANRLGEQGAFEIVREVVGLRGGAGH